MREKTGSPAEGQVPRPIVRVLGRVIGRVRFVITLRGACLVLAATLGALLVVMAIDVSVTIISAWPRWALSLWVLGVALSAAAWFLIRPLAHSFTLSGIARALESRHPELHERISSAIELLGSGDRPEVRGSEALISALAREASHDVMELRPSREVTLRAARPFLLAAGCAVAIVLGLTLAWPDETSRLLARAVAPFLNLPNVAAYQLRVLPGDTVALPDDTVRIEVTVDNDDVARAVLYRTVPRGEPIRSRMTRIADGRDGARRFTLTCPPAREDYRYRVRAGDALSRYYTVRVVPPPAVQRLDVLYDYPDYVGLPPRMERDSDGEIEAVEGTRVTVTAALNKFLSMARLLVDDWQQPVATGTIKPGSEGEPTCTFRFDLLPGLDGHWRLEITDQHGFRNDRSEYPIRSVPDVAPMVRVVHPENTHIRCRPSDRLPVTYAAADDFGLASVELLLKTDGGEVRSRPLSLRPEEGGRSLGASGQTALDFSARAFQGASKVEFQVAAKDNLPETSQGPQEGLSRMFTVMLERDAPSYASQVWDELYRRASQGFNELLRELKAAKESSARVREALAEEDDLTEQAAERVDALAQHVASADVAARRLSDVLGQGPYGPLAARLNDVAERHIGPAGEAVDGIKLDEDAARRAELADEADFQVGAATAAVAEMLQDISALTEVGKRLERLTELTEREKQLAAMRAQIDGQAPPVAMTDEGWHEAQDGVTAELGDILSQTPGGLQAQASRDRQRLRDYAQQAEVLSQEQQALGEDSERESELAELERALDELAEQQEELAEDAGGRELTRDLRAPMSRSADQIRGRALEAAGQGQKEAGQALRGRAERLRREHRDEELLAAVEKMTRKQRDLADTVETLHGTVEQIKAWKGSRPVAEQLAREQQALAERSKRLEAKVAQNAATADREGLKPSGPMTSAAEDLEQGRAPEAADAAQKALRSAQELAQRLRKARQGANAQGVDDLVREADRVAKAQGDLAEKISSLPQELQREFADPEGTAQKLAEAQEAARNLAEPHQQLHEQLQQAGRDYQEATPRAHESFRVRAPIWHTRRLSKLLQEGKLREATARAGESAERLEVLARVQKHLVDRAESVADRMGKAEWIASAAEEQEKLRKALEELSERRRRLREGLHDRHMAWLKAEQAELAEQTARLAYRVDAVSPQEDGLERSASRAAARASGEIEAMQIANAAGSADQAADGLEELAGRFRETAQEMAESSLDEPPADEESAAARAEQTAKHRELAQKSAALAARQRTVAQGLRALAGDRFVPVTVVAQQELTRQAEELHRGARGVRDRLAQTLPGHDVYGRATKGTERLRQAADAGTEAGRLLGAQEPRDAAPQQQEASGHLQAAAHALEEARRHYDRALASADTPDLAAPRAEDSQPLAAAYNAAHEAALTAQALDTALAAQRLDVARARAAARARRMRLMQSPVGVNSLVGRGPDQSADPRDGIEAVPGEDAVVKLRQAGIDLADWGKLPSQLRKDILQAPEEKSPREYRTLIRRYFREIARRGAAERQEGAE